MILSTVLLALALPAHAAVVRVPLEGGPSISLPAPAFDPAAVSGWQGPLYNFGAWAGLVNLPSGCRVSGDPSRRWDTAFGLRLDLPHEAAAVAPLVQVLPAEFKKSLDEIHKLPAPEQARLTVLMDLYRDKVAPHVAKNADALMDKEVRSLHPENETDVERVAGLVRRLEALRPFFETLTLYGGAFETYAWEIDVKATEMRRRLMILRAYQIAGKPLPEAPSGPTFVPLGAHPLPTDLAHVSFQEEVHDTWTGARVYHGLISGTNVRIAVTKHHDIEELRFGVREMVGGMDEPLLKALWVSALAYVRQHPNDEGPRQLLFGVAKAIGLDADLYHVLSAAAGSKG